jgi:EAL domain-containing protein (putative c-di-GMP-specific phosphodiesterase class I)
VTSLRLLHSDPAGQRSFRQLLEPGEIQTVFQPIVDVATGVIVSAEALSRFPRFRRVHLDEVFAVATLEGWGPELEAACLRAALQRRAAISPDVLMAVNVSPDMLSQPIVQHALRGDLGGLAIEITENASQDPSALQYAIQDIRRRGGKIVIDDASSGYAGLLRLSTLRPDVVKIDRSLVTGARGDDVRSVVIDALVNLSHRIGAQVVGEGVETLDDLIGLAELNVDYAQGWVTGPPAETLPSSLPDVVRTCRNSRKAMMASVAAINDPLARIHVITTALTASTDIAELHTVLAAASSDLGVDAIGLSLLTEDGLLHEITATGTAVDRQAYPLWCYPATQEALATNTMIEAHVLDLETDSAERELLARDGFASLLLIPVAASGHNLGILELRTCTHRQWTSEDMAHARTVADHVAGSLVRMSDLPRGG